MAGVGNVIKAHNSSALGVMMEVLHKSSVMMEEPHKFSVMMEVPHKSSVMMEEQCPR